MDSVTQFNFWCQHILPLSYDDSLSYYEVLCKLKDKLNEVITWLDSYEDDLKKYVDEQTAKILLEFQSELAAYKAQMDSQFEELSNDTALALEGMQKELDTITSSVDAKISELDIRVERKIAENKVWVQAKIAELTAFVSAQIAIVYQQLDYNKQFGKDYTNLKIQEMIDSLPFIQTLYVRCPVNGIVMPIQTCLDQMYDALRYGALTAFEYDHLVLTAAEYDAMMLTVSQYDLQAREYLYGHQDAFYTFSGYTGRYITLQDAIAENTQAIRVKGYTASTYDALSLTASEYDALDYTAYVYDWAPAA